MSGLRALVKKKNNKKSGLRSQSPSPHTMSHESVFASGRPLSLDSDGHAVYRTLNPLGPVSSAAASSSGTGPLSPRMPSLSASTSDSDEEDNLFGFEQPAAAATTISVPGYVSLFSSGRSDSLSCGAARRRYPPQDLSLRLDVLPEIANNIGLLAQRFPYYAHVIELQLAESMAQCAQQRTSMAKLEEEHRRALTEHARYLEETFSMLDENVQMSRDFPAFLTRIKDAFASVARSALARLDKQPDLADLPVLHSCLEAFEQAVAARETLALEGQALTVKLGILEKEHRALQKRLEEVSMLHAELSKSFESMKRTRSLLERLSTNAERLSDILAANTDDDKPAGRLDPADPLLASIFEPAAGSDPPLHWDVRQPFDRGVPANLAWLIKPPEAVDAQVGFSFATARRTTAPCDDSKVTELATLLHHATHPNSASASTMTQLLGTFPYYVTPAVLLCLLCIRFCFTCPAGTESHDFKSQEQQPVQIRVLSFIKAWLETYPRHFDEGTRARQLLLHFLDQQRVVGDYPQAVQALRQRLDSPAAVEHAASLSPAPPPEFSSTTFANDPSLLDGLASADFFSVLLPVEVARHIASSLYRLYSRLRIDELQLLAWTRPDRDALAPTIAQLVLHFNGLSGWVVSAVLGEPVLAVRAARIEYFINVAASCDRLNCFHGCISIVSALQSSPVFRLKKTWEAVSPALVGRLKEMTGLLRNNSKELRSRVEKASPPVIPYIGIYLTDLVFLVEGSASYTDDGQINWHKMRAIYQRCDECLRYNKFPYNFDTFPPVLRWLTDYSKNMSTADQDLISQNLAAIEQVGAAGGTPNSPAKSRAASEKDTFSRLVELDLKRRAKHKYS